MNDTTGTCRTCGGPTSAGLERCARCRTPYFGVPPAAQPPGHEGPVASGTDSTPDSTPGSSDHPPPLGPGPGSFGTGPAPFGAMGPHRVTGPGVAGGPAGYGGYGGHRPAPPFGAPGGYGAPNAWAPTPRRKQRSAGSRIAGVVVAVIVGTAVRYGIRQASADDDPARDRQEAAVGATTPSTLPPISAGCNRALEALSGPIDLGPRPGHLAPMPDQPNQRALLMTGAGVHGRLDLSPGGVLSVGDEGELDLNTVFIVCSVPGDLVPTGRTCDYSNFGLPTEPTTTVALSIQRRLVVAHDVSTGREIGREMVDGTGGNPDCPDQATEDDLADGVVAAGPPDNAYLVAWARAHLTGAKWTP